MVTFKEMLDAHSIVLERNVIKQLQVNIGKRCNQACHHCHVEAGPHRTENMTQKTVDRLLDLLANAPQIETVDITGGAPELNPCFRYFVENIVGLDKQVIDRCNLTVFFEAEQQDTPDFLAKNRVQIVASLPCYQADNVDKQRGKHVFQKSIKALQKLNTLGYGKTDSTLLLNLVYNPVGEYLPPPQAKLEADYKRILKREFGIEFNRLFTITNMPISRYAHHLMREGKMQTYKQLLIDNFNPAAADNVMCRTLVSVGWEGTLYDCDFNQMLDMSLGGKALDIWSIDNFESIGSRIHVANHCFGCTAGAGSSCSGALT